MNSDNSIAAVPLLQLSEEFCSNKSVKFIQPSIQIPRNNSLYIYIYILSPQYYASTSQDAGCQTVMKKHVNMERRRHNAYNQGLMLSNLSEITIP